MANPPEFPGGQDGLVRQITTLNASVAGLQQVMDEVKNAVAQMRKDVNESFKTARTLREDEKRILKARSASIGNQVAFLRDNVCHCIKELVSYRIFGS